MDKSMELTLIANSVGKLSFIFITALHLVNFAPNSLYSDNLSLNPSSPSVRTSPLDNARSCVDLSTFIPGNIPLLESKSTILIPSEVFCRKVSSYKMIPLI